MIMKLRTRKALITGLAALALLLTAGLYAVAQQAMDESKRDRTVAAPGGMTITIAAVVSRCGFEWHERKAVAAVVGGRAVVCRWTGLSRPRWS